MMTLNRYDIRAHSVQAANHLLYDNRLTAREFFEGATVLLHTLSGVIGTYIADGLIKHLCTTRPALHPSGFQVYRLGTHEDYGSLRLHIWPQDETGQMREREIRGRGHLPDQGIYDGDIHDHGWFVIGRVVAGIYKDRIFGVTSSKATTPQQGDLHVFNVTYDSEQKLVATGERVVITGKPELRIVPPGKVHTIDYGVFHAPTIPRDELAATLVFNSHRVGPGPKVLVAGSSEPIISRRRLVTPEEEDLAMRQVARHWL